LNDPSPIQPPSTPPTARPVLLPPVVLLRDLGGQLLWPGLLRTPAAALWPSRLVLGLVAALIVGLAGSLSRMWSDKPAFLSALLESQSTAWGGLLGAALRGDVPAAAASLRVALVDAPLRLVAEYPLSTPLLLPLMLGVLVAFGGAIARSVAVESATGRQPTGASVLGWSLARCPSALAAVLVPLLAVWLLIVLMRALGWLGFAIPVLEVVGGLLFPIQVALALATLALILLLGVAGPLIVPARMVEDSDAIDAAQRAAAYLVARPLRVLLYLGVAIGVSALALGLARVLSTGAWSLAVEQSAAWLGRVREGALTGAVPPGADGATGTLSGPARAARWFVGLWSQVPPLLVAGYAISLFFTGATKVYLATRQICDGQDQADIQGASPAVDAAPLALPPREAPSPAPGPHPESA
jgi:hypothetical protein